MNRHRRRRPQQLCVYAIVAMSLTVAGAAAAAASSSPSASETQPCVAAATAPDAREAPDACVTRPPTELLPDGTDSIATGLVQGRGKRKKKKQTAMNILLGGGIMTAFVVMFMFLNMITVTLGKAFLFTFIAKFLVSVNWKSSSPKKKSSGKDVTVVMT